MIRKTNVAEHIDPEVITRQRNLSIMQPKREPYFQKLSNSLQLKTQYFFRWIHQDEIIAIAQIVPRAKLVFYKLIQDVEINVRKKLTREISQRDPNAGSQFEAPDNRPKKSDHPRIVDLFREKREKRFMMDGIKIATNIAFQNPKRPRIVSR